MISPTKFALQYRLPIKLRIKYKLNLQTYKALFMGTPSYISGLLHFEKRQQTLRSDSTKLLHHGPRSKINYGHSSFVVAAPRLWNEFSDYGPPHVILILVHSSIESQNC